MVSQENTPLSQSIPAGESINATEQFERTGRVSNRELADLMAEGDTAAINLDALLILIEDASWSLLNRVSTGAVCTFGDHERASAIHTAAELARREFDKVQSAVAEGGKFITVRALDD